MKICTKCKDKKELADFGNCRRYGKKHRCKECISEQTREYNIKNKDKKLHSSRVHYEKNKDKIKLYRESRKEEHLKYMKNYEVENKERLYEYRINYRLKNKHNRNSYHTLRTKYDPLYKLAHNLRGRMRMAFKGRKFSKNNNTETILGASFEFCKLHIEKQFKPGMSWDNHGRGSDKWNIDHIIPVSSAKTEQRLISLFHYTNLQPLWEPENQSKFTKIITT